MRNGRHARATIVVMMVAVGIGFGAHAQDDQAAPQTIIIGPDESSLSVDIRTNKPRYKPDEALQIHLQLNQDAYVYIYNIQPNGSVRLLFPNGFARNNYLNAGRHTLPATNDYSFVVSEPLGVESLQAIASTTPLPMADLSSQSLDDEAFPVLGQAIQEVKPDVTAMVQDSVQPDSWATAWTQFLVAQSFARLRIESQPEGAQVFVDGQLRGQSPIELVVEPGDVNVVLRKSGYQVWSQELEAQDETQHELSVQLTSDPSPSTPRTPTPPDADADVDVNLGAIEALWFGMNAGLNDNGTFSGGLEIGFSRYLAAGGSLLFTGDDVPEFNDVGQPRNFSNERVYNDGPEAELYGKLAIPFGDRLGFHIGGGMAVQQKAHVAQSSEVVVVGTRSHQPLVEVQPNGYRTSENHLTVFGGVSLQAGSSQLSVSYHNRRGWVIGLAVGF